jgi:hypothetical protein
MIDRRPLRCGALIVAVCWLLIGPVASASASAKSIKAVIESFTPRIEVAEGHVVTAAGEFAQSKAPKNAAPVQTAIGESTRVLGELAEKVAGQPAGTRRVKRARAKIARGLRELIAGYRRLSTAIGEKAAGQPSASSEARKGEAVAVRGRKLLLEGVKLLG